METTSVKIYKHLLEKLRLQYPNMSFNEIMETIALEEENVGRQIYGYENAKQANLLIHDISIKYPGLSLKNAREMILKQVETSSLTTQ